MLYETLSQPTIAYIFLLYGIVVGVVIGASKTINKILGDNSIIRYLLDIIIVCVSYVGYFYLNITYNFGQIRVYTIIITFVGILLEIFGVNFFVAKFIKKVYTDNSPVLKGKEDNDEYCKGKSYNCVNNNSRNNFIDRNADRTDISICYTRKVKARRKNIK